MTYKNGNTIVEIREDGTKIRYVPDNAPALPVYPESIDMKITNRCSMNCPMCHEQSCSNGIHGNLSSNLIKSLHPYTEVAIGGGDPLSHPDIYEFLWKLKKQDVIANITVHWKSFIENYKKLRIWSEEGLVHGVGVSVNEVLPSETVNKIAKFPNAVVHIIIGIANNKVYSQFFDKNANILLLGYKTFGRGFEYRSKNDFDIDIKINIVRKNIEEWISHFRAVSFDNLAIDQLHLKKKLKPEVFNQIYMGNDGAFTMYIDLVENKYAVSSTSERHDIDSNNIDNLFAKVRKMSK